MNLDLNKIASVFAAYQNVEIAVLFGSSQDGIIRNGSDVDIAVLLSPKPTPKDFYKFYQKIASRLSMIPELDLIDLSNASSILAFEALCGQRLFVRNQDTVAKFSSEIARQYEDDIMHAKMYC
jgi:predicted nucleotidyltransferase